MILFVKKQKVYTNHHYTLLYLNFILFWDIMHHDIERNQIPRFLPDQLDVLTQEGVQLCPFCDLLVSFEKNTTI